MPENPTTPLAIVGMACLFPKADGVSSYWANIKQGVDGITEVPASHWDPDSYHDADPKAPDMTYARRGGFLDAVPFDVGAHGIAPNMLEATDASQLLGLVVATEALKNAGYGTERAFDRDRVSVVLGVTGTLQLAIPLGARLGHPHWRKALADCGIESTLAEEVVKRIGDAYVPWQENSFPGLLGNVVAGRIANKLDLGGTNCVVDAACASSLSAAHLAAMELESGRADMVVTGGVDTFNDIFMYMCFSKTPALSGSGDSRPFDQNADGTMLGEGIGMVVLKRLADAERDGDPIWAVLKAIGSSSDGRGKAIYAPSDAGQVKALNTAYKRAGVSPATIELVEAHGTGTKVGDATELAGLLEVYRSAQPEGTWCALGSVKSQIGHTKAAAGSAGLIKAALALYHKVLPPSIKVNTPFAELLDGRSPFYLNAQRRPWLARPEHPRRAAVSAFGFGGSNFHAVLEEYAPVKAAPDWDGRLEILALSAASRQALEQLLTAQTTHADWDAWRVAATASRAAFEPSHPHRLVLVLEREADAQRAVSQALAQLREGRPSWATPDGAYYGEGAPAGGLAVLFPGQGAQYPGMGRDLACLFPQALAALEEADAAFAPARGSQGRLIDLMVPPAAFDDDARKAQATRLRSTDVAQPALGAVGLAAWRVLATFGVKPAAFAGHSYGELVALCAAGRLSAAELHTLSGLRGRLMAGDGGDRGAMLAVRADAKRVAKLVETAGLDVVLANINAPKQVVLSGTTAAIEAASVACEKAEITAVRLDVGAAFHSPLVADAAAGLASALAQMALEPGLVPVYANTTASPYPVEAAAARTLLAEQLARPVEFVAQIEAMAAAGITTFLEVAPGARLGGLVRAILGERGVAVALDASNGSRDGVLDLARALAQLAALGHPVDLTPWQGGTAGIQALIDKPKPRMTVPISGVNHRSPRPVIPALPPVAVAIAEPPRVLVGAVANGHVNGHPPANGTVRAHGAPEAASNGSYGMTNGSNGHAAGMPAMKTAPAFAAGPAPAAQPVSAPAAREAAATQPPADGTWVVEALRASQEGLVALQRLQEQTANLHHQYLSGQEQTQASFMALFDRQQQLFARALGFEGAASAAPVSYQPAYTPSAAPAGGYQLAPSPATPSNGQPAAATAYPAAVPPPALLAAVPQAPVVPAVVPQAPTLSAPAPQAPVAAVLAPVSNGHVSTVAPVLQADTSATALLAVVSEKTGYPTDMLDLSMSLEADLGIDSIKRVEILSAVQEVLPGAPIPRPDQIGSLVTLQDVADFLSAGAPVATPVASPNAGPDTQAISLALLAVVSEKTGYPTDMLSPEMALEADLGIDSIKRVEILSALHEALPGVAAVKPEQMGQLVSLADVIQHLAAAAGATAPIASVNGPVVAASLAPASSPPAVTAPASDDIAAIVLATIAEKTGYPTDMLSPEMALEADLGIDSIKRVEILSALQLALPGAPVARPEDMGTLATVQDLLNFLTAASPGATAVAAPAAVPATAQAEPVALPVVAQAAPVAVPVAAQPEQVASASPTPPTPTEAAVQAAPTPAPAKIEAANKLESVQAPAAAIEVEHASNAPATTSPAEAAPKAAPAKAPPTDAKSAKPPVVRPARTTKPTTRKPAGDPATDAPAWEPIAGLQRLILRATPLGPVEAREAAKLPTGAEVWVADDDAALGRALAEQLTAQGFKVRGATIMDETSWPVGGQAAALFLLAGSHDLVGAAWHPAREHFLAACLRLTQRVGPALLAAGTQGGAVLMTVSRLDGAFGLGDLDPAADPIAGGLAGLAKTAALEWLEVSCQALDVDRDWLDDEAIARGIVRELFLDGPREIGLRPDERVGLELDETPIVAPASGMPFEPGELVIVTGGARGVTAEAAVALARYARPTLALIGRSPAPTPEPTWLTTLEDDAAIKQGLLARAREDGGTLTPRELEERFRATIANREVWRTLARIEAEGSRAVYVSLDIRDGNAVHAAVARLREAHGPVRGLVHGAGVLADRRIGDLTSDQANAVLDTKVAGLRHLLTAIGDEARAIALFSSVTARRGRIGQVAYAIANEALDKIAQQLARKYPDRRIVALQWGPWDGGMVTPALKRLFAEEGVAVVPLGAGAEFLAQELAQPAGAAVEVLVLGAHPAPVAASVDVKAAADKPVRLQTAFSRWLTPKQYPFMSSHVMNGRAVLPVAMMVEWMAHGALHANPGLQFLGLRELRVFRGVVLDDAPYGIRVAASHAKRAEGLLEVVVELRGTGDNDTLHARTTVLLGEQALALPTDVVTLPGKGDYPRKLTDAYRDILFHGPDFQAIKAVSRFSADGLVAEVDTAPVPGEWIQAPLRDGWLADPLALDAAFQLMILWSVEQLGAPCLPAFIGDYRQYRPFPKTGASLVVKVVNRRGSQAIADIAFVDAQGEPIARMRDAECTVDAGLAEAFRRNMLAPSLLGP